MKKTKFNVPLRLKERALASSSEGITISDPNLADNPIIYVNSGFEEITGYKREEVLGRNCRFLQGAGTNPKAKEIIRTAISEHKPCRVEILNYKKDGSTFWNRLSITPVRDDGGNLTHFIGVQSDITYRRNTEDKLKNANTQIKKNLDLAANIQRSLLPATVVKCKNADFSWKFMPCEELAGDTLNIIGLDKTHVGVYIIDVSGHGVASALLSFSLCQMLSPMPENSSLFSFDKNSGIYLVSEPVEVLEKLNRRFPIDYKIGQYFTMIYGIINLETYEFTFAAAGHPGPILASKDNDSEILPVRSFPIGFSQRPEYTQKTVKLNAGDRVILYTDGVTEAFNCKGKIFGEERLLRAIDKQRAYSIQDCLNNIMVSLDRWSCHSKLRDDVSLIGMEIKSNPEIMYNL